VDIAAFHLVLDGVVNVEALDADLGEGAARLAFSRVDLGDEQIDVRFADGEVDPKNWTKRIVNPKSGERSACRRRDVSTVQS
jgi:hypothetical protein